MPNEKKPKLSAEEQYAAFWRLQKLFRTRMEGALAGTSVYGPQER